MGVDHTLRHMLVCERGRRGDHMSASIVDGESVVGDRSVHGWHTASLGLAFLAQPAVVIMRQGELKGRQERPGEQPGSRTGAGRKTGLDERSI